MGKKVEKLLSRVSIYLLILGFFLLYQLLMAPGEWQFMNNNMFIPAVCLILFYMSLPAIYFRVENKKALNRPVIYLLIFSFLIIYSFVPRQIVLAASAWCDMTTHCYGSLGSCEGTCGVGACWECNVCSYNLCRLANGGCNDELGCEPGTYCPANSGCNTPGGGCNTQTFCNPSDVCQSGVYYDGRKCNGGGTCNVLNTIVNPDQNRYACESCASDQTGSDEGIKYLVNGVNANYDPGLTPNCCGDDAGEYYRCQYTNSGGTPSGPDCGRQSCCNSVNSCIATSPANTCYRGNAGNYYLSGAYHCCQKYFYTCNTLASHAGVDTPCGLCCAGNANANMGWTTSPLTEDQYSCSDTYDNDCDGDSDNSDTECCPLIDGNPNTAGCGRVNSKEWDWGVDGGDCTNNKWLINDPVNEAGASNDLQGVWMQDTDDYLFVMLNVETGGTIANTWYVYFDPDSDGTYECNVRVSGSGVAVYNSGGNCGTSGSAWSASGTVGEMRIGMGYICGSCCGSSCSGTSGNVRVYVQDSSGESDRGPQISDSPNYKTYNLSCSGPTVPIPEFLFGAITAFVILMFILGLARRQRITIQE